MTLRCTAAVLAASYIATCWPGVSLATRAYGDLVTGEVTAPVVGATIEIAHRRYHIKSKSTASKTMLGVHAGELVDLILDGPVSDPKSEVVSLQPHSS